MMTNNQPSDVAIKVLSRQFQILVRSLIVVMSLTAASLQVSAQSPGSATRRGTKATNYPASRNREIARIVSAMDARNVERTIRKLVSFGTRNSLSTQSDPNRGIGAARDWIYAEFLKWQKHRADA
jgi:hypothetical protein